MICMTKMNHEYLNYNKSVFLQEVKAMSDNIWPVYLS